MKRYNLIIIGLVFFIFGCTDSYIDEIVAVDPGPDMEAPEVIINFPLEGTLIRVPEEVTPININFEVMDDIEIESIKILLDGNEIGNYNEFLDFRRVVKIHTYETLGNGPHTLTIEAKDLSGKSSSKSVSFEKVEPYTPIYDDEIFYMPFDGDFMELVSTEIASVQGSPTFANGVIGTAYNGTNNAYLTFPTTGLLHDEFSAAFWYNVNGDPNRAGILVIGPPDTVNPNNMNNRRNGFRLFREAAGSMQRVKLNIGNGTADNWFDGGAAADIDPASGEWVHIAITISQSNAAVYINGNVVREGSFPGVDWTETDILSIGSGAPRFTGWGHLSDGSLIDELRIFSRALNQSEIQTIIDAEKP
ncbi:LamG domain-containing protein [Aquiflexum lacus]|uniref:LamG domain-containing protein n=1 Tax=Aquiflexum lacus TaxID=2483805 RepID=UPI0018944CE5|nr:LamG domain-containing protein [Aquiflexum lacus]